MKREERDGRILVLDAGSVSAEKTVDQICRAGRAVRLMTEKVPEAGVLPAGQAETETLFAGVSGVVIASMPLYLVRKVTELDDGEPFAGAVLRALCEGLPVWAVKSGVDPAGEGCPPRLAEQIRRLLGTFSEMGVSVVPDVSFFAGADRPGRQGGERRKVVTAEDVQRSGGAVLIGEGDLVTPLARDLLRRIHHEGRW